MCINNPVASNSQNDCNVFASLLKNTCWQKPTYYTVILTVTANRSPSDYHTPPATTHT